MSSAVSFNSLVEWENLLLAHRKAAKGKRGRPPAAEFEQQLADKLVMLQRDLRNRTYTPDLTAIFYSRAETP